MLLTQAQACKELNITRGTILNWEKKGLLKPYRTSGKHRRYELTELHRLLGIENSDGTQSTTKKCVVYCRVSTKKQADTGNLQRQIDRVVDYAKKEGYQVEKTYSEIASGINENRRELIKMLDYLKKQEVEYLIVEYKDRLARFGFNYIQKMCEAVNVKIIVLEDVQDKDINQEMAEDIISIITSFSARLYGRRGAKNIKKTLIKLQETEV